MLRSPEADVSAALLRAAEQVRDNEQVQEAVQDAMEQLRYRLREDMRRRRWRQLAAWYRATTWRARANRSRPYPLNAQRTEGYDQGH